MIDPLEDQDKMQKMSSDELWRIFREWSDSWDAMANRSIILKLCRGHPAIVPDISDNLVLHSLSRVLYYKHETKIHQCRTLRGSNVRLSASDTIHKSAVVWLAFSRHTLTFFITGSS